MRRARRADSSGSSAARRFWWLLPSCRNGGPLCGPPLACAGLVLFELVAVSEGVSRAEGFDQAPAFGVVLVGHEGVDVAGHGAVGERVDVLQAQVDEDCH